MVWLQLVVSSFILCFEGSSLWLIMSHFKQGDYTFKIMSRQEKAFTIIGSITGENRVVTSLIWLTAEILVAGLASNELYFVEGGDPKLNFNAETTEIIDLSKSKEE